MLTLLQDYEATLTPNQWDLIEDIYANSGGHLTVLELCQEHGWSRYDLDLMMPELEALGVCAYDSIKTPHGTELAVGLYRVTIVMLEDRELANNTPDALRIAELEAEVNTLTHHNNLLATAIDEWRTNASKANKEFAKERAVFYERIDLLDSRLDKIQLITQGRG